MSCHSEQGDVSSDSTTSPTSSEPEYSCSKELPGTPTLNFLGGAVNKFGKVAGLKLDGCPETTSCFEDEQLIVDEVRTSTWQRIQGGEFTDVVGNGSHVAGVSQEVEQGQSDSGQIPAHYAHVPSESTAEREVAEDEEGWEGQKGETTTVEDVDLSAQVDRKEQASKHSIETVAIASFPNFQKQESETSLTLSQPAPLATSTLLNQTHSETASIDQSCMCNSHNCSGRGIGDGAVGKEDGVEDKEEGKKAVQEVKEAEQHSDGAGQQRNGNAAAPPSFQDVCPCDADRDRFSEVLANYEAEVDMLPPSYGDVIESEASEEEEEGHRLSSSSASTTSSDSSSECIDACTFTTSHLSPREQYAEGLLLGSSVSTFSQDDSSATDFGYGDFGSSRSSSVRSTFTHDFEFETSKQGSFPYSQNDAASHHLLLGDSDSSSDFDVTGISFLLDSASPPLCDSFLEESLDDPSPESDQTLCDKSTCASEYNNTPSGVDASTTLPVDEVQFTEVANHPPSPILSLPTSRSYPSSECKQPVGREESNEFKGSIRSEIHVDQKQSCGKVSGRVMSRSMSQNDSIGKSCVTDGPDGHKDQNKGRCFAAQEHAASVNPPNTSLNDSYSVRSHSKTQELKVSVSSEASEVDSISSSTSRTSSIFQPHAFEANAIGTEQTSTAIAAGAEAFSEALDGNAYACAETSCAATAEVCCKEMSNQADIPLVSQKSASTTISEQESEDPESSSDQGNSPCTHAPSIAKCKPGSQKASKAKSFRSRRTGGSRDSRGSSTKGVLSFGRSTNKDKQQFLTLRKELIEAPLPGSEKLTQKASQKRKEARTPQKNHLFVILPALSNQKRGAYCFQHA